MSTETKIIRGISYSIYTTIICCVICVVYAFLFRKGKRVTFGDLVITVSLVLISSLRYDVGTDYNRYIRSAARVPELFSGFRSLFSYSTLQQWSFEVGFESLSLIANRLSNSPYTIFWITSIIIYCPIVLYARRYTSNACRSLSFFILFGFWGMSLNIIKQFIAMVCMLFFWEALKKKSYVVCILLGVIAIVFHTSVIVVEILLILVYSGILQKVLKPTYFTLGIVVVVGIGLRISTWWMSRILSLSRLLSKYVNYTISDSMSRSFIMLNALIEAVIVISLVYTAIKNRESLKEKDPYIDKVISLLMIGIVFNIVGISKTMWLSKRFAEYFYIFLLTVIPDLFEDRVKHNNKAFTLVLNRKAITFWGIMVVWHMLYSVLSLDNHGFRLQTYLFK